MEKPLTLRRIPSVLFKEFSRTGLPRERANTEEGRIKISWAKKGEGEKTHTLVLCENDYSASFQVFNTPIRAIDYVKGDYILGPELTVVYTALNPRFFDNIQYQSRVWREGKGFWVEEVLDTHFDPDMGARINSAFGDWEFGFFLRILNRAYSLFSELSITGYWEVEVNKDGDYNQRPKGR